MDPGTRQEMIDLAGVKEIYDVLVRSKVFFEESPHDLHIILDDFYDEYFLLL